MSCCSRRQYLPTRPGTHRNDPLLSPLKRHGAVEPAFLGGAASAVAAAAAVALLLERVQRQTDQLERCKTYVEYSVRPKNAGAPCVVLEAGANSWSSVWRGVVSELSPNMRAFSYDRAGFGRSLLDQSSPASVPATASQLITLLREYDARPPYVLVTHSLGALFVNEAVRRLHPDEILGIVYVDAASLETVNLLRNIVPSAVAPRWLARLLSALGVLRALAPLALSPYSSAFSKWPSLLHEARAVWATSDWLLAYTSEWVQAMREVDDNDALRGQWLGDMPISVIIPDVYDRTEGKEYVGAMQRILASYSSDARLVHVKNCGHFVQIERPDVVVEAVRDVIRRAEKRKSAVSLPSRQA